MHSQLLAPHPHCETIHRSLDAERRSRREVEVEAGESARSICQGRHVSERAEEETVSMTGRTACLSQGGPREPGVSPCHLGAPSSS